MRRLLDYQANRIEMVLHQHKAPSRVWGGTVTPRFVQFQLTPWPGIKLNRLKNLAEEIALSLGSPSCRVYRQGGVVNVEVPRSTSQTVPLLPLCRRLAHIPPHSAVLGLDERGVPILLRLPSPEVAHVLIAGTTGSGKTALARAMIASLALHNRQGEVQLALIDPKSRGFAPFQGLPHLLAPVVDDPQETTAVLHRLVQEMESRDRRQVNQPRIVIFIDELADLVLVGGREVETVLTRLTQRGRGAGLHLVACTQKPTAAVIGSLVKSNFPVRLVGSVTSPEDAKVASGLAGSGAERLLGRGDFLLVCKGRWERFQAAYISGAEIVEVVGRLQEGGRRRRRWLTEGVEVRSKQALLPRLKEKLTSPLKLVK